ncbi:nuclear transport factor 2 family protein [Clostridium sp.]|uniref:nuclear transport factor 2 family protein n=1 Tax=Clostridium sp. TaxID=1506 RepID=UPI0032180325
MKNQVNNELKEILNVFNEAYIKRDINEIDSFMDKLFDKDESVTVVGTCDGEWCIGYEEVKDIFLSDWEYWGDLRVKVDEATVIELDNTAIIYTPGTVKYSFNSRSKTYTRYLGYIKEYFDESSDDSKKPNKVKLTEINWTLSHLLNQRDSIERDYLWDIRISFILTEKENRWIIKHMQFSFPVVGYLPEVREYDDSCDRDEVNKKIKELEEAYHKNMLMKNEIIDLMKDFNSDYLDENMEINLIVDKYFSSNNILVANTDKDIFTSKDEIKKLIENQRECYDEMRLDSENSIVDFNGDTAWIVISGAMKKVISEEESFENTVNTIKDIFNKDLNDKEKLFNIRRRIAETFKENAKGEEYIWPFRLEGVLIKENNNWVFKYLQFAFPFYYILEGKTEAASLI